jgi:hypothetical protein
MYFAIVCVPSDIASPMPWFLSMDVDALHHPINSSLKVKPIRRHFVIHSMSSG